VIAITISIFRETTDQQLFGLLPILLLRAPSLQRTYRISLLPYASTSRDRSLMTYLQFHLIFNLPLLALLFWMTRRKLRPVHLKWIAVVCAIVLLFTAPWDNWAIGEKIWEFDDDRILFRIMNLPIEEIVFFLVEAVAVCLVVVLFLPTRRSQ